MAPRPQTLAEIADRADSFARFGRELQDWLHMLRSARSRPAIAGMSIAEPRLDM